jgi:hypothetical protein
MSKGFFQIHLIPLSILIVVAIFMLRANPFVGETVGPFDLLNQFAGWKSQPIDLPLLHWQHSDILDYKLPAWRYAKQQLRHGKLPLWSPYAMGGKPSMQLTQHSIITPAFLLYAAFEQDAPGFYAAALVNLTILSIGSYLFLYALYPFPLEAWIGAVVFSYCGFNSAWFYWHHVNTSIWIPWLLYFTTRYLDTQNRRFLPWITIASAFMILGGFPIVAVYGYLALVLLLLFRAPFIEGYHFKTWLMPLVFIALSCIVCAFALQPLAESLLWADLSYREGGSPLTLSDFVLYLNPEAQQPIIEKALYVGIIPIICLLPALWLAWQKKYDWKMSWGLTLIVFSIAFAFMLIPANWIRMIPLIGSNPWNRMVILASLGFSIITTATLYYLARSKFFRSKPKHWIMLLLSSLAILQTVDQYRYFKHFVGPVPSSSFYPETKTLVAVKHNIQPLQSIVADFGFLFSGTLSYYGLPEWFAHGIRSARDKETLRMVSFNGFVTNTAAQLDCMDIEFNGLAMTYLDIAYTLCTDYSKELKKVVQDTSSVPDAIPSESITTHQVTQYFYLPINTSFNELELEIATHNQPQMSANLYIDILKDTQKIATATCPAADLKDNRYVKCPLDHLLKMMPGNYSLTPHYHPKIGGEKLSVWMAPPPFDKVYMISDGILGEYVLHSRFIRNRHWDWLSNARQKKLLTQYEPDIYVIKNPAVEGSAYFIDDLNYGVQPNFKPVKLIANSDTQFDLAYSGKKPGWVVLPMRNYPGWQASVNGQPVRTELFLQTLPAIPVAGPTQITYQYRPRAFYMACGISLIGLLTTVFLIWRYRR